MGYTNFAIFQGCYGQLNFSIVAHLPSIFLEDLMKIGWAVLEISLPKKRKIKKKG